MAEPILTLGEVIIRTTDFFRGKGIVTPRLDAELLVGEVLGMDRLQVYLSFDRPMAESEMARARELVRRRAGMEPVAYILGRRDFFGRSFEVNPAVLIPRPETELLVEAALAALRDERWAGEAELRVLEFGVGSGAIAVSLAAEEPRVQVVATEISPAAAEVARRNAERHGVSDRVTLLVQADFEGVGDGFHVLAANPPYVDPADKATMMPDVVNHEPHQALFADNLGYAAIEQVLKAAPELLATGGSVIMEVGAGQMDKTKEIAKAAGLAEVSVIKDYAGIERILVAYKL
ncbi:peptide chain release factor N(5)-glutamine methyltransferase [candidate division BRC1 bacterium HGW-BRC1-1]|jgi:release factor glutamine methyltransferase|nr:MAG: peptide chain release factor N(5)-glutamine methyltransferase [candidate division BRC1 bacterium HGW-BRC1-1]